MSAPERQISVVCPDQCRLPEEVEGKAVVAATVAASAADNPSVIARSIAKGLGQNTHDRARARPDCASDVWSARSVNCRLGWLSTTDSRSPTRSTTKCWIGTLID